VFLKHRWRNGVRRCYRSKTFLHLIAGCHTVSVMHAHSGSTHGITLQLITKHAWRCPSRMRQRVPTRIIMNPNACSCDILPATAPLELDTEPLPAPPPPPTPAGISCPPSQLATKGWELCSWQLSSPPTVPPGAVDLAGVPDMQVRYNTSIVCAFIDIMILWWCRQLLPEYSIDSLAVCMLTRPSSALTSYSSVCLPVVTGGGQSLAREKLPHGEIHQLPPSLRPGALSKCLQPSNSHPLKICKSHSKSSPQMASR
jgi:hypothetical protein